MVGLFCNLCTVCAAIFEQPNCSVQIKRDDENNAGAAVREELFRVVKDLFQLAKKTEGIRQESSPVPNAKYLPQVLEESGITKIKFKPTKSRTTETDPFIFQVYQPLCGLGAQCIPPNIP